MQKGRMIGILVVTFLTLAPAVFADCSERPNKGVGVNNNLAKTELGAQQKVISRDEYKMRRDALKTLGQNYISYSLRKAFTSGSLSAAECDAIIQQHRDRAMAIVRGEAGIELEPDLAAATESASTGE